MQFCRRIVTKFRGDADAAEAGHRWAGGLDNEQTPSMKTKINIGHPEDGEGDELLDKLDIAQWLNVSVGMVDVLRRAGKLQAIKVGRKVRFERAEVKRYVEGEREGNRGGRREKNAAPR